MNPELRRYPRIACETPGELVPGDGAALPVTIRTLSCEGIGLELGDGVQVIPASVVAVRFSLPDGPVALTARVVWVAGQRAGLHLRLADIDADSKRAFGAWIGPRTKEALARARAG
jgi:hypothetical protein